MDMAYDCCRWAYADGIYWHILTSRVAAAAAHHPSATSAQAQTRPPDTKAQQQAICMQLLHLDMRPHRYIYMHTTGFASAFQQ